MGRPHIGGEGGLAAKPLGVLAGGDDQLTGMVVADRQQPQQPGSGSTDECDQAGKPTGHEDHELRLEY